MNRCDSYFVQIILNTEHVQNWDIYYSDSKFSSHSLRHDPLLDRGEDQFHSPMTTVHGYSAEQALEALHKRLKGIGLEWGMC